MRFAMLGGLVCACAVPLDRHLCAHLWGSLSHVHLAFLGCDLALLGLLQYARHGDQRGAGAGKWQ
jgi:hypothetical protein